MKTVSLELAKQLKEAGFPQESSFWWSQELNKSWGLRHGRYFSIVLAAPTAGELLDTLPTEIKIRKEIEGYNIYQPALIIQGSIVEKNLADAAAKMWLYLKKNNLLIR